MAKIPPVAKDVAIQIQIQNLHVGCQTPRQIITYLFYAPSYLQKDSLLWGYLRIGIKLKMENFGYLYSIAVVAGGLVGYVKKGKCWICERWMADVQRGLTSSSAVADKPARRVASRQTATF